MLATMTVSVRTPVAAVAAVAAEQQHVDAVLARPTGRRRRSSGTVADCDVVAEQAGDQVALDGGEVGRLEGGRRDAEGEQDDEGAADEVLAARRRRPGASTRYPAMTTSDQTTARPTAAAMISSRPVGLTASRIGDVLAGRGQPGAEPTRSDQAGEQRPADLAVARGEERRCRAGAPRRRSGRGCGRSPGAGRRSSAASWPAGGTARGTASRGAGRRADASGGRSAAPRLRAGRTACARVQPRGERASAQHPHLRVAWSAHRLPHCWGM